MNKFISVIISLWLCVALNVEARPQFSSFLSLGSSLASAASDAVTTGATTVTNAASTAASSAISVLPGASSTSNSTSATEDAASTITDFSGGMQNTFSKGIEEGQTLFNAFQSLLASWGGWFPKTAAEVGTRQAAATADAAVAAIG